jgi:hypothetical protein
LSFFERKVERAETAHEALLALPVDVHLVMLRLADLIELELARINALDPLPR